MDENYSVSPTFKFIILGIVFVGIITIGLGLYINPEKTWANFLLSNYYFISIIVGATFFLAIQYITQSGWSAMFIRIPHAIGMYMPVAAITILFLIFGMHSIYHWSIPGVAEHSPEIEHKSPYLNIPFFFIRLVIIFALWILMTWLLRKTSLKEDHESNLKYFYKSEYYSKIYIFILAITFSLLTFDLIMSIDVYWFSTVFAVKNFVSGFYHAVSVITLIVILLNRNGYFRDLNKTHLRYFSRYIFILGIIWAYLWFIQYLLIWFANIQEETIYYVIRTEGKWKTFFFLNIILNWAIPFSILLPARTNANKLVLIFISIILIIGHWVDLYLQIMPGSVGEFNIGYIEIGVFAGFSGLFIFIVSRALGRIPLIPKNHPYLGESINLH
ncbi:MAG: hypothetical protein IIB05_09555 [Bacteroidetes bacterium]|nr:hypothetical protein [Bacteroidota bacterium]